jgi:hypothetical protein
MAAKAPIITARAQFPNELYRNIIGNLHHFTERETLLHLALVSKVWCAESQRVLFRTVCDDFMDTDERRSLIHTQTLFLKAIILNPTRLGPYVQTYKQRQLICHPDLAMDSQNPIASASSYLWDLAEKALPAFVNLKHLFIVPILSYSRPPPVSLLDGCTFKLESLRWGFKTFYPNSTDSLVEFLRTQHDLLHLEVGYYPLQEEFPWLPDDVCPSLISATCELDSVAHIMAKPRNIVGLTTKSDWFPQQMIPQSHLSALHCLKYLSLWAHRDFMSNWGTTDSNAVLLELIAWDLRTVQNFSGLPNLRVLVLLRVPREATLAGRWGDMDEKAEHSLRIQLTIESFRRCPKLEYIIIEDMHRGQGPRRYRKLSISGINEAPNTEQEIQSEEFPIVHEVGIPWWLAYGGWH